MNKEQWKNYKEEIEGLKDIIIGNNNKIRNLRNQFFSLPNDTDTILVDRLLNQIKELKEENETFRNEINNIYKETIF